MAGDWIKVEMSTPDKPEVVSIANILGIDQDAAFGKCVRLWMWADSQTEDGYALNVTNVFIDRITFCTGFAQALHQVGWLSETDGKLTIPNFDRHNGKSAKSRANSANRMKAKRERDGRSVTHVTPPPSLKAQPEKRRVREEINKKQTGDCAYSPFLDDADFADLFEKFKASSRANHNWVIAESTAEAWLMQLHDLGLEDAKAALVFSTAAGAKKPITNGDHKASEERKPRGYAGETAKERFERMLPK